MGAKQVKARRKVADKPRTDLRAMNGRPVAAPQSKVRRAIAAVREWLAGIIR